MCRFPILVVLIIGRKGTLKRRGIQRMVPTRFQEHAIAAVVKYPYARIG